MTISLMASTLLLASAAGADAANPLEWKSDLALWTAVVFLCLLAVLWKFAWKPIVEGLDKREKSVADQIAGAEAANRQAKETLAEYERKLAAAAGEVRALRAQGRRDAEEQGRAMLAQAKEAAAAEHAEAVRRIEAATDAALKALAERSAALAVDLAGKIVHAELKPADHVRLIDEAITGFSQSKDASRT